MGIRVALHHRTTYRYDRLVTLSPQVVRLRPAPHCRTPVTAYSLQVQPEQHFLNWQQDPHGNFLARLVFPKPTRQFQLQVDLVADLTVINPFDFFLESEALEYPFRYADWLGDELRPYLRTLPASPRLQEFLAGVPREAQGTVDFLVALNRYVHHAVRYVIRLEHGVQACDQTLQLGSGSCRDSAWLLVQVLRHLGLAARFVSGYLIQLKPDVKPLDGPAGTEQDFTDLHAWTEVYLPGAGWVGLDPTSGLLTGEGHLPLAATPDAGSAAPVTGGVDESRVEFDVRDVGPADPRNPTRHQAVHRLAMGGDYHPGTPRGHRAAGGRRATDDGRRADVRLGRRHGRRRVERGGRGSEQTPAGRNSVPPIGPPVRVGTAAALRPRQVVSRRVAAALGLELLLAERWSADLGASGTDCGGRRRQRGRPGRRPKPSSPRWPAGCRSARSSSCPATKTPGTTCGRSAGCRSMSIRCSRSWKIPRSERGWRGCSSRAWGGSWDTRCRCGRGRPAPARVGKAARGSCGPSGWCCCPAIRRWDFACPWIRSRGPPSGASRRSTKWTRWRRAAGYRNTRVLRSSNRQPSAAPGCR